MPGIVKSAMKVLSRLKLFLIKSLIKELKNNKSTGPSSIPSKFLKLFQIALSKLISLIANLSFSSGTFPNNLKLANK